MPEGATGAMAGAGGGLGAEDAVTVRPLPDGLPEVRPWRRCSEGCRRSGGSDRRWPWGTAPLTAAGLARMRVLHSRMMVRLSFDLQRNVDERSLVLLVEVHGLVSVLAFALAVEMQRPLVFLT